MRKLLLSAALLLCSLLIAAPSFAAYMPPSSDIVVFVDEEGGVRKDISNMSRVPVFCLYKDGTLIYSTIGEDGLVFLMKSTMDESKIAEVRRFFESSDEWNDVYEDSPMKDMPVVTITYTSGSDVRKFTVRGIDYAMRQKTIPSDMAAFYRYAAFYSDPDAKEYESDEIYIFVKQASKPDEDSLHRVIGWRVNVDLAALVDEGGMSGVSSARLSGKNAKRALKTLKYFVPFMTADLPVFVRQKKNYYSVGFRPLLPHELK